MESPRSHETTVFPWRLPPHINLFQRLPDCTVPQLQRIELTVMEVLTMIPTPVAIHFIRVLLLTQMDYITAHGKEKIRTAIINLRS